MKNLIPHFIQEQFLNGKTQGQLEAYTLFVDLSGFTPLTQALMQQGTPGAEQLSNILNEIFEPLVRLVYMKGASSLTSPATLSPPSSPPGRAARATSSRPR